MAPLLVITGPPGAGKTTVARSVAQTFDKSALVEGDAFFGFLSSGAIAPWLPEAHDQNDSVIRVAASAAGQFASAGYVTIFDGIVGPVVPADVRRGYWAGRIALRGVDAVDRDLRKTGRDPGRPRIHR